MPVPAALAIAVTFVWLGMVLAISFLEAPLKFRARGVTLPVGLAIGRLVFRVLNTVECVLAVVLAVALVLDRARSDGQVLDHGPGTPFVWAAVAVVSLVVQVVLVRPGLARRTDAVLASDAPQSVPRSSAHLWYIATEVTKVVGLAVAGVLLLATAL